VAYIIRVEELAEQETSVKQAASKALLAACSSETSVDFHRTTRRYIPEDRTLHKHGCENLKSYKGLLFTTKPCSCFRHT
jgi:hypothetical protein